MVTINKKEIIDLANSLISSTNRRTVECSKVIFNDPLKEYNAAFVKAGKEAFDKAAEKFILERKTK